MTEPIALVVSDGHERHDVRERGNPEVPGRLRSILAGIRKLGDLFEPVRAKRRPLREVAALHDPAMVDWLRRMHTAAAGSRPVYPEVFPVRNADRPPRPLAARAGWYCFDVETPVGRHSLAAAKRAVECAMVAAGELLRGRRAAFALVRPPGHHAERARFGGYCYLNSAAAAAELLSGRGTVALLDVDYHHGNGQQDIFYERADMLTVSIHADPALDYPFFTGFADERGAGAGEGFNLNVPLPLGRTGRQYLRALESALAAVDAFGPEFLVVPLGFDGAEGDPIGRWRLKAVHFREIGRAIGALRHPTLIVQEGGYDVPALGTCAREFFRGLAEER